MAAGSSEKAPRKLGCAAGTPQLLVEHEAENRQEVESDRKWSQTGSGVRLSKLKAWPQ